MKSTGGRLDRRRRNLAARATDRTADAVRLATLRARLRRDARGILAVLSRATDARGRTQPLVPAWNPAGYLWNAPDRVRFEVRDVARLAPPRRPRRRGRHLRTDATALEAGKVVYERTCRACHDSALIEAQRLTQPAWVRSIAKMVQWGARVDATGPMRWRPIWRRGGAHHSDVKLRHLPRPIKLPRLDGSRPRDALAIAVVAVRGPGARRCLPRHHQVDACNRQTEPSTYLGVTGSFQMSTPHRLATTTPERRTSGEAIDNGAPARNAPYRATVTTLNPAPTPRA